MKKIEVTGDMPRPVRALGLLTTQMDNRRDETRISLQTTDPELAAILAAPPEVWECNGVEELSIVANFDECEMQVLIDKAVGRYYLCAMSVDPERTRTKIEDTPSGPILVEDEGPKSPMVLYYTEIVEAEFKKWQEADTRRRRETAAEVASLTTKE